MKKPTLSESNFHLWQLIGKLNHLIIIARQKELDQHHIPVRQYMVLCTIRDLGSKATLCEVAQQVDRQSTVISRQLVNMEKNGLIKRIRDMPGSNLMRLELTEKGLNVIKVARNAKSIDAIFSFLSKEERQEMETIANRIIIKADKYNSKVRS